MKDGEIFSFLEDGVEVVKRGEGGLFALSKPAGILSHPNPGKAGEKCLFRGDYDFKQQAYLVGGERKPVYLLHRLDSATSGVILLSDSLETAKAVRGAFRDCAVEKTYHAIVQGKPGQKRWEDKLLIQKKDGKMGVLVSSRGDVAITDVEVEASEVREGVLLSRVCLRPQTGRTHQLRVQAAHRRNFILGDKQYGDFRWNRELGAKRLYLHASRVAVRYGKLDFEAAVELPEGFLDFF